MFKNESKYKVVLGKSKFIKFSIPEHWELSSIGGIGKYINGMAFRPEQWKKSGIPIIRIQNLTDDSASFNYFDEHFDKIYQIDNDDILISWSATLGVFKWKKGKAVLNQHIFKAIPNYNLDKNFFYYAIGQQVEQMKNMIHGTTMKHITKQPFLDTSIPLPPLNEQQKIASILSNLDELIQKTDQIIEQTQRLKTGLMQRLLTKGIDHTKFKKTKFGDIPEDWKIMTLMDISLNGIRNGIFKKRDDFGEGVPLVNVSDLFSDYEIDVTKLERVKVTKEELKQFHIEEGDLFFCRSSLVADGIGKSNSVSYLPENAVYECHVMMIRPNKNYVNPKFLLYYSQSNFTKRFLLSIAMTLTMTTIRQPDLERLPILLPSLNEQQKIASILSSVDELIQKEKINKSNLENLKKGLMQQLLTGRIRVKV